jgi:UDP-2-acetamido-2-deoxy-ribo-hexuluronate aminotransferase
MNIDFANLKLAYMAHQEVFEKEISRVLSDASYIMGPEIEKLEAGLSQFTGAKHSVSCSSGTDALLLAMMALDIKPGDEIITTPFTFISTAETIALLGAKPVFVDIDEETFNIDVNLIEPKITQKTKAIVPVSLFGQVADMDEINTLAEKHNLSVIEDAAQSFGATYKGKKSCNLSTIACTSFFPAKPLGCFGDGGAVFTSNNALAEKIKSLRVHGQTQPYTHKHIGLGARLDNVQAAVLLIKLKSYNDAINMRQAAAERYHKMLDGIIQTPVVKNYNTSVWAQYSIKIPSRDLIKSKLKEQGIPTAVYYPKPLHLQKCFEYLNYKTGDFPVSENAAKEIISLPINPYITVTEQKFIVEELKKCL